jgi:hypothetical protein
MAVVENKSNKVFLTFLPEAGVELFVSVFLFTSIRSEYHESCDAIKDYGIGCDTNNLLLVFFGILLAIIVARLLYIVVVSIVFSLGSNNLVFAKTVAANIVFAYFILVAGALYFGALDSVLPYLLL